MLRNICFLSCFLLAACDDTTAGDTDDTDGGTECENGISSQSPAIDATNAYYQGDVTVTFDAADDAATLVVSNAGTEVAGSTAWEGDVLVWTGDEALLPSTTYDVTVTYECGSPSWSFSTSEVGTPAEAASLTGRTYVLDLAGGNFVQPAGVGPLLQTQLTMDILIGVTNATDTSVEMMGALGAEGISPPEQDLCQETINFPTAADFSGNPFFSVGPDTTTLSVQGMDIIVDDLEISGAFAPDGSYISGATMAGAIDTRPLVGLIDPEGSESTICDLVATFGVACEPCSDGSGDFCLTLLVTEMDAEELAGTSLVARNADDIAADATCD
jgi:hypothetical protein